MKHRKRSIPKYRQTSVAKTYCRLPSRQKQAISPLSDYPFPNHAPNIFQPPTNRGSRICFSSKTDLFRLKNGQYHTPQRKNCLPRNTISSTVQVSRSVQSLKSIRSHQSTPSSPHSIPTLEILETKAYFLKETRIPYPLRIMMIQKRCIAGKTHPPIFANPLSEPYSKVVSRIELRVSAGDILRISVKPSGSPIRHYYPILEGEELWIAYDIWNTGKNPLVISEIQTSCGCIVADEGKRIIPPGHDERLMFRYDSSKN